MKSSLVVLVILDGWGLAPESKGNAITLAKTPNFDKLWASYPRTTLLASQEAVGLPKGEVGNTETGHLNIGAGRIVYQDLARVNQAISSGAFFTNEAFIGAINHAKANNTNLHLMGLVGAGGIHSSLEHLFGLLRLSKEQAFDRVFLHLFTDGRDSPPASAGDYVAQIEEIIKSENVGKIASVMGRYWAMDRDLRWDRTEKAYCALTEGLGEHVLSAAEAIEKSYTADLTDEFINPHIIVNDSKPVALIQEKDAVIFFNFRIDRPRQLSEAFVFENFEVEATAKPDFDPYMERYYKSHIATLPKSDPFKRKPKIKDLYFATMTDYAKSISSYAKVAFPPVIIRMPLAGHLSARNLLQLRLSETEKERFVTFYFNGQQELKFPGEQRKIIPSPDVTSYDKKPSMSSRELTETFLDMITDTNRENFSFVLINFASPDMVGHTGKIDASIEACQVVDECLGKIIQRVETVGGVTLVSADHGNVEELLTAEGKVDTEHSINPVPFIIVGKQFLGKPQTLPQGILADIAPTILKLLEIPKPEDMTGRALI
ncbi:MAG: 2,3-bisphosphoglycerate-independent phosphoglycerate mutase [bacterium]|nr:2,3-bisphosphoglycerate-independent phosphoglycerate mutase [bacterium]